MRSTDDDELRRALEAVRNAYLAEVREHDAELAAKLDEPLRSAT